MIQTLCFALLYSQLSDFPKQKCSALNLDLDVSEWGAQTHGENQQQRVWDFCCGGRNSAATAYGEMGDDREEVQVMMEEPHENEGKKPSDGEKNGKERYVRKRNDLVVKEKLKKKKMMMTTTTTMKVCLL